jgi:hypothetical protein
MMTIYDKTRPWNAGDYPSVLAIGDSWSWYPFSNLLDQINSNPKAGGKYTGIMRLGFNGAASIEYVGAGQYAPDFNRELLPDNFKFYSGFFLSGGGNDAVSYPNLHTGPYTFGLKSECRGITEPAQCLDEDRVQLLLRQVVGAMGTTISHIVHAFQADVDAGRRTAQDRVDIFLHGYAYPYPDDRGVNFAGFDLGDPWIGRVMTAAGVNPDLAFRFNVTKALVDRLHRSLSSFDGMYEDRVHYIDSRSAFGTQFDPNYKTNWANELHPTPNGFRTMVDQYWMPMLANYGFANR